jgi:predicted RNA-binding protein with RPS1 domain
VVLAEVDDIVGSIADPTAVFKIKGFDTPYTAKMSTGSLRPNEKLALQAGSVMKVVVTKADGAGIWVSLDRSSSSGDTDASISKKSPPNVYEGNHPVAKKTVTRKEPALILNNLKTGTKLQGTVTADTHYAAFVDVHVYRHSKGGAYTKLHGMLHSTDQKHHIKKGEIEKGKNITVYVKEVFKNSGKFSLTLDPTINKAKVLETRLAVRTEGNARRRARRIRRMLDTANVGDTVAGVVQQVSADGVLVTITSLGPLNVTGLIKKRDLPKQFEVPPDLKEAFQRQLLQQDFVQGRPITCGVVKVEMKTTPRTPYNFQLLFEELGAMPAEDPLSSVSVKDLPASIEYEKGGDDEDEDAVEDDVADIFNELRGTSPLLSVDNFRAWGDLQVNTITLYSTLF